MQLDLAGEQPTPVWVMAWCRQALPEPMLIQVYVAMWRQYATMD